MLLIFFTFGGGAIHLENQAFMQVSKQTIELRH